MTHAEMEQMIDYDDFNYARKIGVREFVNARRCKIRDSTTMLALVPFADYVEQRGGEMDSELRALMEIGMSAGIACKVKNNKK
ncbi:hypothetical protein PFISCL1PPCAC_18607 [Pristionchus fissidentatus]|uniref:Uncharacterized protein n=1 Tax=Pristionchus fissidentatus TaxID=1538716 RepID=A0AAV5W9H9_9BILA|nr:hypothetical protein PFISCL1PPCAC_18607 [Pristionchus fissidentatus]